MKGFEALGAHCGFKAGRIEVESENGPVGSSIYFDKVSVGATANMILASVLAEGTTVIENAAREPHIVDLANFLNSCGANITGAGTSVIKVHGVESLHGAEYTIIPDMIEAGTYMVAAAITGGNVYVRSVIPKHVETVTAKLCEMGVCVDEEEDSLHIHTERKSAFKNINIKTLPYPGFPTDMHPQFAPMLCLADGISCIQENIWDNRFRYIAELRKMGANVMLDSRTATFIGSQKLTGAPVSATDLRGGAALVIAGLAADGKTEISGVKYIKRGYENLVGKLQSIGARIDEIEED
jgi:UDP-N-acetylglucosamine 1-carboxyvinyltransferase